METVVHVTSLGVIALILGGIGVGLALLNARAIRLPLDRRPSLMRSLPVGLPALAWAGMCVWMLYLIASDPTAANLWPLTAALMATLWLGWIAASWIIATVIRRFRPE